MLPREVNVSFVFELAWLRKPAGVGVTFTTLLFLCGNPGVAPGVPGKADED